MSELQKAVNAYRRNQNIDTLIGYLGDGSGSGDPRLRDGTGRMWARTLLSGRYSPPVALPIDTNANIPPQDNVQVEIGMLNGEQTILRATRTGLIRSGLNPAITNAADPQVKGSGVTGVSTQFWCKRSTDSAKEWTVVVESGYLEIDGEALLFVESEIDLESFVPAAGEKCLACIYLQTDLTLVAYASAAVLMSDPIIPDYIDECRQQAADSDISIWGWVLEGDAIGLSENPNKNINLQANINIPQTSGAADDTGIYIGIWW